MSTKTIYAKTLNPEDFDYRIYDIEEDDYNEVFILGTRDNPAIDNKDYLAKIKTLMNDYDSWDYEYYYHNKIKDFLYDMLPKKENKKRLSPCELGEIKRLLESYSKDYSDKTRELAVYCGCLSIITGKEYTCRYLHGCCQGDVVIAFYPTGTTQHYIDFVEAWYFGTGTEILIHDCQTPPKDESEIEGFTFYTGTWNTEQLKREIKSECGYKDEDDVDVVLWLYENSTYTRHDNYKRAD